MWDAVKAILRVKFIDLVLILKIQWAQANKVSFLINKLENQCKLCPKQRKEIIKTGAENIENEHKKIAEK